MYWEIHSGICIMMVLSKLDLFGVIMKHSPNATLLNLVPSLPGTLRIHLAVYGHVNEYK